MVLRDIINEYVSLRADIENKDNGKAKIGCVDLPAKRKYYLWVVLSAAGR